MGAPRAASSIVQACPTSAMVPKPARHPRGTHHRPPRAAGHTRRHGTSACDTLSDDHPCTRASRFLGLFYCTCPIRGIELDAPPKERTPDLRLSIVRRKRVGGMGSERRSEEVKDGGRCEQGERQRRASEGRMVHGDTRQAEVEAEMNTEALSRNGSRRQPPRRRKPQKGQ